MKLAVLLVGEYRTFPFCRKTQTFLDQPEIDVYFHTWSVTNTINPVRANTEGWRDYKPILREVTHTEVESIINRPCTIKITPLPEKSKNPMIEGWLNGLELVKASGIEYDYMLVMRPDLFFQSNVQLLPRQLFLYEKALGARMPPVKDPYCLDDTCFLSSYKNIQKILTPELYDNEWLGHHQWFKHVVLKNKLSLTKLPFVGDNLIARFPMDDTKTFEDVSTQWWNWFKDGK